MSVELYYMYIVHVQVQNRIHILLVVCRLFIQNLKIVLSLSKSSESSMYMLFFRFTSLKDCIIGVRTANWLSQNVPKR